MKNIDEKELHEIFNKMRKDDKKSYEELYKKYYKLVYNIAFKIYRRDIVMKVIYPVLFYEEKEGGYSVFVPDLQNHSTCGSTLEEAMSMAEDLIAGIVLDLS